MMPGVSPCESKIASITSASGEHTPSLNYLTPNEFEDVHSTHIQLAAWS
jgi:hypothetical protein